MPPTKLKSLSQTLIRSDAALLLFVFCLTLSIFLISRVHQVADSQYSMMVSQSLIDHRSFALDHYAIPRHTPIWSGYYFKNGPVYQLEIVSDRVYYHFPQGSSVLSAPFVALLNIVGVSAVRPNGSYDPRGEVMIEAGLAALLMATLAGVWFYTARLMLPAGWSFLIAVGGALGTQVYSTASRALWSETWGIFLLGMVILMLLTHEVRKRGLRPVLLASLLAWMFFVRPTFAVPIVAVSLYILFFHRQFFLSYAVTGAAWFAGFVLLSWKLYGRLLPSYYGANRLSFEHFGTALAGNLISPGRGLFVYVPVLMFVAYLLVRYRRQIPHQRLVWLSLSVILVHLLLISGFPHWWAGHSFGPRFSTGLVPWFVLLGILGVKAMLSGHSAPQPHRPVVPRAPLFVGSALLIASLFINTLGATSHATWLWNQRPRDVDAHPERLWDWRQPQFLAKYLPYPPPDEFPVLSPGVTDFSKPDSSKYLWYGWAPADEGAWADNNAALVFSLATDEAVTLHLNLSAFLVLRKVGRTTGYDQLKPATVDYVHD